MTLENFPQHYTYTITAEVHADNDGRPWEVHVKNGGGLDNDVLAKVAMQALDNWEGSSRPRWELMPQAQLEDNLVKFNVYSLFG